MQHIFYTIRISVNMKGMNLKGIHVHAIISGLLRPRKKSKKTTYIGDDDVKEISTVLKLFLEKHRLTNPRVEIKLECLGLRGRCDAIFTQNSSCGNFVREILIDWKFVHRNKQPTEENQLQLNMYKLMYEEIMTKTNENKEVAIAVVNIVYNKYRGFTFNMIELPILNKQYMWGLINSAKQKING